ncbi:MAG TPA: hypothetical protein VJH97_04590 [Candidatus Nanoarchaeia archaeon]|nr:hypothetical protein [Candidatus Nanoarchaeia archaeon]
MTENCGSSMNTRDQSRPHVYIARVPLEELWHPGNRYWAEFRDVHDGCVQSTEPLFSYFPLEVASMKAKAAARAKGVLVFQDEAFRPTFEPGCSYTH